MIGLVLLISTGLIFYALYREVQNIKYDIQSLKTHASDEIKNEDLCHEIFEDEEVLETKESEDDETYSSPFDLTAENIDISFFQNLIPSIGMKLPKQTLTSITEINEEEDPVPTDSVIEPIEETIDPEPYTEINDLVEICDQSSPKKIKSKGKKSKKNILA